jgi:uncharacterized protein (TIGR04255 family)
MRYDPGGLREPSDHLQPVTFGRPPVVELAFAVQFSGSPIDVEVLGAIARSVKGALPNQQQHPALPRMSEQFDRNSGVQIIFKTAAELPRAWFVSDDGQRLLQLQGDRLAYNWRQVLSEQLYPRYEGLRGEFSSHLQQLSAVIAETNAAPLGIDVCELSYVNHLATVEPSAGHPPLSRFLRYLAPMAGPDFLPEAEDARLQARWLMRASVPDSGSQPIGRLYAEATPVFQVGGEPAYLLTLTARMVGEELDRAGALALLDIGHEWIVRGFKDITTDEMHHTWDLTEAT